MPYRFDPRQPVGREATRIAIEQIERARGELTDSGRGRHIRVHRARKRIKKLRGLSRLVRPGLGKAYRRDNDWLRDTGRGLSGLRDAQALVETVDMLQARFGDALDGGLLPRLRHGLEARRRDLANHDGDLDAAMKKADGRLAQAAGAVSRWPLEAADEGVLLDGLAKTYSRGRDAFRDAYSAPSSTALHAWRKRVKYHGHHLRLLRRTWPPLVSAWIAEVKELADVLGDEHDLSVLAATLADAPPPDLEAAEIDVVLGAVQRRQAQLRLMAQAKGSRLFAEKPGQIRARMAAYWKTADGEPGRGDGPVDVRAGPRPAPVLPDTLTG